MESNTPYTFDRVVRIVLTILIFAGFIFLIKKLGAVLLPFIIAVFIAYLLNPMVNFIQKHLKTGRGFSSVIVVLLFLSGFTALLWWLIPTFLHEMNRMGRLVTVYLQSAYLHDSTMTLELKIKELIMQYNLVQYFDVDSIINLLPKIIPSFWSFFTGSINVLTSSVVFLIVILYVIFLLIDFDRLSESWSQIIPVKYRPIVEKVAFDIKESMQLYIRSQGLIALLVGIMMTIGFGLIGLPMAVAMGIMMGLLNLIPYMQIAGILPVMLLALLKSLDHGTPFWKEALLVGIVLAVVQIIQELILNPRILGKAYSINPALILLSLSIWGSLLGIMGMMLALPLTTLIYSYYKNFIVLEKEIIKPSEEETTNEPPNDEVGKNN